MSDKKEYLDPNLNSESGSHWLPWLKEHLEINGTPSYAPEMPESYNPNYEKWLSVFERFEINEDTILVGHSCGAGFIVKFLSENNIKVGKVVLVAPWINSKGEEEIEMFNNLHLDGNLTLKTSGITIFASSNDDQTVKDSIEKITESIQNIKLVNFENYGHFCLEDMNTREFPELLKEALQE